MSNDQKALREFWIIDETPYSTWVSNKPLHSADTKEEIHVIEYSAYKTLQAKHARAVELLNVVSVTFGGMTTSVLADLMPLHSLIEDSFFLLKKIEQFLKETEAEKESKDK